MPGYSHLNTATLGRVIASSFLEMTLNCLKDFDLSFQLLQRITENVGTWPPLGCVSDNMRRAKDHA